MVADNGVSWLTDRHYLFAKSVRNKGNLLQQKSTTSSLCLKAERMTGITSWAFVNLVTRGSLPFRAGGGGRLFGRVARFNDADPLE